ncbi:MAG: DUF2779 domain-containing protein [Bacillota bacterium]|nr:DUF2779 domain-containing protein [Bacillota bacterium]
MSAYLTKSLFQLALSCPAKLFYAGKAAYANRSLEDSFLASLAEGGFQIGALAKCYYPEGEEVDTSNTMEALRQTNLLMQRDEAVIFEAAFSHGSLLVRTDILVKKGNLLELFEVKAKSFTPEKDSFFNKNSSLSSGWKNYLYDVAFQKHVLRQAMPDMEIRAYLVLADKSALCPENGLNQMFRIRRDEREQVRVVVSPKLEPRHLTPSILVKEPADEACEQIYRIGLKLADETLSFDGYVNKLARCVTRDEKIHSSIGSVCRGCEFRATEQELLQGVKCGFRECWTEQLCWTNADFEEPTVLDIWNYRRKDALMAQGRVKLTDVLPEDIPIKPDKRPGLSPGERQWLQVKKVQARDTSPWIDKDGLRAEMSAWRFPLHFIDFETSMAAIPFNKGRRPYEGIAFQFSHHIIEQDGTVRHAGEYLNTLPGVFPNYAFIRELKRQLERDQGSIFRYADHENTFLNIIYQQLLDDTAPPDDRDELCVFIQSITKSSGSSPVQWEGPRNMADMLEMVKRYYYHPATNGSNSIKQVLPAVLGSSAFLQNKYSKPIYGAPSGIPSLNYRNWVWVKQDASGHVMDPYKLLPPMFLDLSTQENELISQDNEIRDGGAALAAYARMQFEEMGDYEREQINTALKKYCELDTLAMVMIYEAWAEMIS